MARLADRVTFATFLQPRRPGDPAREDALADELCQARRAAAIASELSEEVARTDAAGASALAGPLVAAVSQASGVAHGAIDAAVAAMGAVAIEMLGAVLWTAAVSAGKPAAARGLLIRGRFTRSARPERGVHQLRDQQDNNEAGRWHGWRPPTCNRGSQERERNDVDEGNAVSHMPCGPPCDERGPVVGRAGNPDRCDDLSGQANVIHHLLPLAGPKTRSTKRATAPDTPVAATSRTGCTRSPRAAMKNATGAHSSGELTP